MNRALLIFLCGLIMALSGCSMDAGNMSIIKPIDDDTIIQLAGTTKDASVQKEMVYYAARTARDKLYASMYKLSGFNVEFEMMEVKPGVFVQTMKKVSFKEAPRFEQPMPDGPSFHPIWKTTEKFIDRGFDAFEWWTAITGLLSFGEKSLDQASTQYHGDYNPRTAEPYIVRPEIITVQ